MRHTQENCFSLHGLLDKAANVSKSKKVDPKFFIEEYQEYLRLNLAAKHNLPLNLVYQQLTFLKPL